ncbi:MAG: hypothetical protein ACREDK_07115 [Thermoplasmata archaeon]
MSEPLPATPDGPARRRDSWSLKTLVEDVAGRPITDFQEPDRPMHPYLKVKFAPGAESSNPRSSPAHRPPMARLAEAADEEFDPVARVYPPLVGATGRSLHGPQDEHHRATLSTFRDDDEPMSPGVRPHRPGPSRRPERIYLHYLLLHLDRLTDGALRYLKHSVDEEIAHRDAPRLP